MQLEIVRERGVANQAKLDDEVRYSKLDKRSCRQLVFSFALLFFEFSEVEARPSRVGESGEREGFDDGSVERERSPKLGRASSGTTSWLLWLNPQDCH
jgi:hypothetical protein